MNRLLAVCAYCAVAGCLLTAAASAQVVPVTAKNAANGTPVYDIDQPGRIPYQATKLVTNINNPQAIVTFNAVPAGHRLVIQQVSSQIVTHSGAPADTKLLAVLHAQMSGLESVYFAPTPFLNNFPIGSFVQSLQFYVDGGDQPVLQLTVYIVDFDYVIATLVGYLVDCNAAPCAAISGSNGNHLLKPAAPVK